MWIVDDCPGSVATCTNIAWLLLNLKANLKKKHIGSGSYDPEETLCGVPPTGVEWSDTFHPGQEVSLGLMPLVGTHLSSHHEETPSTHTSGCFSAPYCSASHFHFYAPKFKAKEVFAPKCIP